MRDFTVDYAKLEDKLLKRSYRLSEVEGQIERVAFDIVRFKDGDKGAALWQIQSAEDGDYIVSLYEEPKEDTVKNASLPWEVIFSKATKTLNFFYKGEPVVKVAARNLGIPEDEIELAKRYLPRSLSENKSLVSALLSSLKTESKDQLLAKYPELS